MTDQYADLDAALDRVIDAARAHLAAVKAAQGRIDDDDVWQAYVALNNASFEYDERLLDEFGEVTPWDVESIDPDEADRRLGLGVGGLDGGAADDPYPQVVSVRQRRDYRVPSVAALLRLAEAARRTAAAGTVHTSFAFPPEEQQQVFGADFSPVGLGERNRELLGRLLELAARDGFLVGDRRFTVDELFPASALGGA